MSGSRVRRAVRVRLSVAGIVVVSAFAAPAVAGATSYITVPNSSPNVDSISDGSVPAPWNASQGVTSFDSQAISSYPGSDLLPEFNFAAQSTFNTQAVAATGAPQEPNVATYPAESGDEPFPSGFAGTPGPLSGYCGASYDDSWDTSNLAISPNATFDGNLPVDQPAGESLPFSPYYFPYIVRNSDGSLTGYFDWRPKDADEAIVVAKSTDGGMTWTSEGEALEQNPGYCPSGDTNDDGEGHPYVADLGSDGSQLYTLQRADGDLAGVGLLSHPVDPSAANPLAGVPSTESVGSDPNTFAASATTVEATAGTGVSIPVSTLGGDAATGNSTSVTGGGNTLTIPDENAIAAGQFVDVTAEQSQDLTQDQATITCTGVSGSTGNSPQLTGCTAGTTTATNGDNESGFTVGANDDLVQAIGTISSVVVDSDKATTVSTTIPYAANPSAAGTTGPAGGVNIAQTDGVDISFTAGSGSNNSPTTLFTANNNAPNRFHINGSAVYCIQSNAEPTTKIENCTTSNPSGVTVAAGDSVVADPTDPAAAGGGPTTQTSGLIAPDGIIGPLPSADNSDWDNFDNNGITVPANATVTLYTEKLLNYFVEGGINGTVSAGGASSYTNFKTDTAGVLTKSQTGTTATLETGFVNAPSASNENGTSTGTDYNISPFPTESEQLPTSGSFNVYVGAETSSSGAEFNTLTCTGWDVNNKIADLYNPNLSTIDLLGCTGTSSTGSSNSVPATDVYNAGHQGNWVAGPGASIESVNSGDTAVLPQIGEGKAVTAKQAEKLFGNNEDYEVVRAAYTTDGVNFTDLGAISGTDTSAESGDGTTTGSYTDISDPFQQDSPAGNPSSGGPAANADIDPANPQGDAPTSLPVGAADTTELRWPGARGTLITNPDGTIGMFLSGAWASDGDSDAFNQVFYTQSSDGGKTWTVPKVVVSTDYTFSASAAQDSAVAAGDTSSPLGVSAYYSGRAYDPTVVQNPDGTLTLVFAGYRMPSPVTAAGSPVGTNSAAQYCEGPVAPASASQCVSGGTPTLSETDPALYRNILTETLAPQIAPAVTTGAASLLSTSRATIAGTVLPYAQATTYTVAYGTSASALSTTTAAQSAGDGDSPWAISVPLTGLTAGTTYYYEVQATNASGTTDGTVESFTTTSAATTTSTNTTTTTTSTNTTTTTTSTTKPPTTKTVSAKVGNQKLTLTLPAGSACTATSKKLDVKFTRAAVKGAKPVLSFESAKAYLGKGVKHVAKVKGHRVTTYEPNAVLRKASDSFSLSLKGLSKGSHTLKIVVLYTEKVGHKTKTISKTISGTFKVC
jgi:hypothetical protein